MAEEAEVWQEIRDALHQLAEQGERLTEQIERQTALLEERVEQEKRRGAMTGERLFATIVAIVVAMLALGWNVALVYAIGIELLPVWFWAILGLLGMVVILNLMNTYTPLLTGLGELILSLWRPLLR